MNPIVHAARLGLARGWVEFRRTLTRFDEIGFSVFMAVAFVVVRFMQRGRTVERTSLSLAMATLPSVLGLMIVQGALTGAAGSLTLEREDGTLLRARTIPHEVIGYLVGRSLSVSLVAVLGMVVVLVPGLIVVPELASTGITGWVTLACVVVLGLLATLPWGAIIGSMAKSPQALFGLVMLPIIILTANSGIVYPISAMPGWLQRVAQAFPMYWMGLGMRSALLPDSAAAAEIAGSWRHLQTVGVLVAWTVAGFFVAPPVLRRMARQSGSTMQQRRQLAMQRAH